MFIRWKKRMTVSKAKLYNPSYRYVAGKYITYYDTMDKKALTDDEKTLSLSAYLCTSVRIDGKPRQKAVYLANINYERRDRVDRQAHFWKLALEKLDSLSLSAEQRQSIEDALSKRIPRPSDEVIARNEAETQAWIQYLTSKIKGRV